MKIARTAVSATSHNGVLYAVGGECAQGLIRDDTVYLRSLEAYDPIMKVCFFIYTWDHFCDATLFFVFLLELQ